MFGPDTDEAFYVAVGRVLMVMALLELRLLDLWTELERVDQYEHAGESASVLVQGSRDQMSRFAPAFDRSTDVLDRVTAALHNPQNRRSQPWPSPSVDDAWGWRPARKGQHSDPAQPYKETTFVGTELRDFCCISRPPCPRGRRPTEPCRGRPLDREPLARTSTADGSLLECFSGPLDCQRQVPAIVAP